MVICLSVLPELWRIDTLVLFKLASWRLAVSFLSSLFHCQNITAFPVVRIHYLFDVSSFLCRSSNQTLTYWHTRNRTATVTLSELHDTISLYAKDLKRFELSLNRFEGDCTIHYATSPKCFLGRKVCRRFELLSVGSEPTVLVLYSNRLCEIRESNSCFILGKDM